MVDLIVSEVEVTSERGNAEKEEESIKTFEIIFYVVH